GTLLGRSSARLSRGRLGGPSADRRPEQGRLRRAQGLHPPGAGEGRADRAGRVDRRPGDCALPEPRRSPGAASPARQAVSPEGAAHLACAPVGAQRRRHARPLSAAREDHDRGAAADPPARGVRPRAGRRRDLRRGGGAHAAHARRPGGGAAPAAHRLLRIERSIDIFASPEQVWKLVDDPDEYTRFMAGITRWRVEGRKKRGCGARYSMLMEVGSAQIGGLIEVVEYDAPGDMAWTSITGIDQRGRWRLREQDDGTTKVTLRISYHAPGGLLATLSDRLSARIVGRNIEESLERLRAAVEGERLSDDNETQVNPVAMALNKLHTVR